jgi:hypothetical protein
LPECVTESDKHDDSFEGFVERKVNNVDCGDNDGEKNRRWWRYRRLFVLTSFSNERRQVYIYVPHGMF